MDTKTILSQAKARFSHNQNKEYLKAKYQGKLVFAQQGGMWTASPELLAQLASSPAKSLVLLDNYENPIKIDRFELLMFANDLYVAVMHEWHEEYNKLQSLR